MVTGQQQELLNMDGQQPMSLMTVRNINFRTSTPSKQRANSGSSAHDDGDDELLTLRILEASERKMMMIKELLSPEEYQSLASDLFTSPIEFGRRRKELSRLQTEFGTANSSSIGGRQQWPDMEAGPQSEPAFGLAEDESEPQQSEAQPRLSRSESNLNQQQDQQQPARQVRISGNIKQNLDRRRKAIEFFFEGAPKEVAANLVLESRFSQYLEPRSGSEERLLDSGGRTVSGLAYLFAMMLSLLHWLVELLPNGDQPEPSKEESAIEPNGLATPKETKEMETKFMNRHKVLNYAPYTRKSNMLAMIQRLKADNQFEKLVQLAYPKANKKVLGKQARKRQQQQQIISITRPEGDFKLRLIGLKLSRWVATRSATASPVSIDHAGASKILVHDSSVECLALASERVSELLLNQLEDKTKPDPVSTSIVWPTVELRFERICIEQHKLLHHEVRLARKLNDLYQQHELLVSLLERVSFRSDGLLSEFTQQLEKKTEASSNLGFKMMVQSFERLIRLLELKCNLLTRISMKQLRLSMVWSELEVARASQGFNLTALKLHLTVQEDKEAIDGEQSQATINRLVQSVDQSLGIDDRELCSKQLKRLHKLMEFEQTRLRETSRLQQVKLDPVGLDKTPKEEEMPQDELDWKQKLNEWLNSLRFTIKPLDSSSHGSRLRLCNLNTDSWDDLCNLDLTKGEGGQLNQQASLLLVQTGSSLPSKLRLRLEASQKSSRFANISGERLLKQVTIAVPIGSDVGLLNEQGPKRRRYEVQLDWQASEDRDDGDEPLVRVSLEFSVLCLLGNPRSSSKVDNLHQPVSVAQAERARWILIDRLYAGLFVAERNPFENTHTKMAKLLNRISRRTLISIMNEMGLNVRASPRPYCVLNHRLFSFESSSISETMALNLANFKPVNLRFVLLALRWANQMVNKRPSLHLDPQQPMASVMVYLSERENLQRLQALKFDSSSSQQLQEFRSKLAGDRTGSISQSERLAGYKSIEQTRLLAVDYIRRLEQLIDQILEAHYSLKDNTQEPVQAGAATSDGHRPRMTARDLLIEPKVTLTRPTVSLDVAQLMRSLVPRPTARRPLMPKRRRLQDPTGGGSKLSQLVEQAKFAANKGPTRGELEMNAIGQWWRSGGNKRSSDESLRLIVTIQQASNVPYRSILAQNPHLNRQQQQSFFLGSPLPVSSSPFFSPSPLFGGAASPLGVPNASLQQRLLVPATTYVEAIFQRKQLASSLAQGRNPAWNETLFFSVDLGSGVAGGDSTFSSSSNQRQVQLVDECLQLNLYDCRSFLQDPAGGGVASETADLEGQWATLGANGGQLDPMLLASGGGSANRLLVAQRRIERHLIGSLRIPMSALLTTSGRVEGSFALSQPLLLDNYHYDAELMQFQSISRNHHQHELGLDQLTAGSDTGQDSGTGSRTHLSLFITLDPPVSLPISVQLPTGSHERIDLFEFAKLWEQIMLRFVPPSGGFGSNKSRQTRLNRNHNTSWSQSRNGGGSSQATSQRHIRALVLRDDARYCFVCRYLKPMQPPEALMQPQVVNENQDEPEEEIGDQRDEQMRRLARFVSLLSPLKYGLFNMRLLASSLWFDSGQLLAGQLGGHEEKAVLLCNYFLQLGKCSALLLGESLQSGRCVYVLVWSEQLKTGGGLGQLELQMDELMEELTTAGRQSSTRGATSQVRPVDQSNFIARLPILINSRSCHLWDPSLGVRHELSAHNTDSQASRPLISVGSIVTIENVYANLQPNVGVSRLSFDIRQKNLWFPLISADHRPPPASLNNSDNNLFGAEPSASQVESNRVAIERDSRRILQLSWRRKLAHLELLAKLVGRPALTSSGSFGSSPSLAFNEPSQSSYDSFGPAQCQELKEALERSIKSHLLMWRPTRPTYFNRTLSRIIAEKLASFERRLLQPDNRCQSQTDTGMDERQEDLNRRRMATNPDWWRAELAELVRNETANLGGGLGALGGGLGATSSQVISWPINLAYTSMQAIIDGLYASGVHNSDLVLESSPPAFSGEAKVGSGQPLASQQPNNQLSTQFLVAAHVEPYPARVMSVWLYVGALVTANQAQANRQLL